MIALVQPFGLRDNSGGARIMRTLLGGDHPPTMVINTGYKSPRQGPEEIHLPLRPSFRALEFTRFYRAICVSDRLFRPDFESRFRRVLRNSQVKVIHTIPHTYDIVPVTRVATRLKIPLFLNVHDDLEYTGRSHPLIRQMVKSLGNAWRNAAGIFVISDEMGREYSRRYGAREYQIITDGLASVADVPRSRPPRSLRVYFMGLFHMGYVDNLRAVLDALKIVRKLQPDWDISITCRCGALPCPVNSEDVSLSVLPFAPESEVEKDMLSADLLYLPLPFQTDAANFGRLSLSTKLVTYLGSGLPILYHGPGDTAASTLLARHQAAVSATTLDPATIAELLIQSTENRESIVNNALSLARARFMLADQKLRFWQPLMAAQ